MAQTLNTGSGIYYNEIDLTVVQQNAGTFAGAAIALTEKGPAFQSMGFSTFDNYALRMGTLNPNFKSSYFASEFLAQAGNYKTVRVLGLEGYNENISYNSSNVNVGGTGKAFVIMYANNNAATPASSVKRITNISGNTISLSETTGLSGGSPITIKGVHGVGDAANPNNTPNVTVPLSGLYYINDINGLNITLSQYSGNPLVLTPVTLTGTYVQGTGQLAGTQPVIAAAHSIAAVLKPRRSLDPSFAPIDYITVAEATAPDGTVGATDYLFSINIYYEGNQISNPPLGPIKVSLRPGDAHYIANVFGTNPLDSTKLLGTSSPLWVEFVYPSVKCIPSTDGASGYYYPGFGASNSQEYDPQSSTPGSLPTPLTYLDIVTGNMTVDLNFTYQPLGITVVSIVDGLIEIATAVAHHYTNGSLVKLEGTGITGLDNTWHITGATTNVFYVKDENGNNPTYNGAPISGVYTQTTSSLASKVFTPTWEPEIMTLGGQGQEIQYQTPLSPWFVSDFDHNGQTQRLFRVWSISDGESANTEIKLQISNINPNGNNSYGSFDLLVRDFNDSEDGGIVAYEVWSNLTMNPKSSNYILKRIGDGDQYKLQSSYIFIEMNSDDVINTGALPYGCEGYPNISGLSTPDISFTTQYNLAKPISRQILGLSNNSINTFKAVTSDNLSFKNISSSNSVSKGFHLNPQYLTAQDPTVIGGAGVGGVQDVTLYNTLEGYFFLTDHRAYNVSSTSSTKVTGLQKVARSQYVVCMFGGSDGWNVYSERTWDDETTNDRIALNKAIDVLSDKESLYTDFSVLVTPDLDFQNFPTATSAVLEMVKTRADAIYLFDFDYGYISGLRPTINSTSAKEALDGSDMHSSFSACYYPDAQLADNLNGVNPWVPASIVALATIASTATNENVWQPPAGSLRTVTTNLIRTRKRMLEGDRNILKSGHINPITEFPGTGFEITESRTTQDVFSALSFIHNRLLLGYAKKALNQVLRPLLQQLKSQPTRDAFLNAVRPIFARIKRANGLSDFDVIATGLPEDQTTLHGRIVIVPLYPVEKIVVDFVLQDGAINYNNQ